MRDLPEVAKKALDEAGIDVATVICVDKKGKTHMMKDKNVRGKDAKFPIENTTIEDITPMSMVRHKGSTCVTIIIGGSSQTIWW